MPSSPKREYLEGSDKAYDAADTIQKLGRSIEIRSDHRIGLADAGIAIGRLRLKLGINDQR